MSRSRSYCFTLNNPCGGAELYNVIDKISYIVVGDEVGESGTKHHQGYVRFTSAVSFNVAKKRLPEGCHIEVAKGSPQQNAEYCTKEKLLYTIGDCPKQGKRTDLDTVRELIANGKGMRTICDEVTSFQSLRGAELMLKYKESVRDWVPNVYWLWGDTGTGKTRTAYEESTDPWISGKSLRWWEGYDAHEDVIIDDFRGDFCTFHELLRILDRTPYRVEHKGGSRQLLARNIWITSPYPPERVYNTVENVDQLLRRITEIRCLNCTDDIAQKSGVILSPDFMLSLLT